MKPMSKAELTAIIGNTIGTLTATDIKRLWQSLKAIPGAQESPESKSQEPALSTLVANFPIY
jgi:hypothetical protein